MGNIILFGVLIFIAIIIIYGIITYENDMNNMIQPNTKWVKNNELVPFETPYVIVKEVKKNSHNTPWVRFIEYDGHDNYIGQRACEAFVFFLNYCLIEESNEKK